MSIDISKYYLDIKKVSGLDEISRKYIHEYYRDMMMLFEDHKTISATSIFNTLSHSDYLVNIDEENRDKKINSIIE